MRELVEVPQISPQPGLDQTPRMAFLSISLPQQLRRRFDHASELVAAEFHHLSSFATRPPMSPCTKVAVTRGLVPGALLAFILSAHLGHGESTCWQRRRSCRQGAPRTCGTGHRNCALLGFWQRLQALSSLVLGLRWTSAKTSSTMSSRPWCVDFPLLLLRSASYDNPTSIHVARSQSQTHCSFGNDALHPKETTACREPASHTACRFFTRSPGTHPGSSFRVYRNA